jgi:aminoglycoside phosphotransferase (APT) family kinase protein
MDSIIDALENARIGEVFRSRKNRVFRVLLAGETLVAKVYPPGGDARASNEYSVLQACVEREVAVPRPVKHSGRALLMEYVEGMTATESIDSSPARTEPTLLSIIEWLSEFHGAHGSRLCRGDGVLHNFLMTPEGVVGIDFEEAHEGRPLEDLGQVIASFLSMRPAFVPVKMSVARRAAGEYLKRTGIDSGTEIPLAVSDALRHYAKFRDDGDTLLAWADRIARDGLVSREK